MRQRRIQPGGGDGLFEDLRRIGAVGQQGHHAIAFPGLDLRLGARLAEQRPLGLGAGSASSTETDSTPASSSASDSASACASRQFRTSSRMTRISVNQGRCASLCSR